MNIKPREMKANELRIGNAVEYDSKIFTVKEIRNYFVICDRGKGNVDFTIEDIKPIPLTEEILLRCGFELNEEKSLWQIDNCGLRLMDIAGKYYRANFPIKVDLTTLHQLQNLYFALTNEELTFKD